MLASDCNRDGEDDSCPTKTGQRWQRTISQEQRDTLENAKEATRQRTQKARAAIRGNVPAYARREEYSNSLESGQQTPERTGETEVHELEDTAASEEHQSGAQKPQPSSACGVQSLCQDPGLAWDREEPNIGQQPAVVRRLEADLACTQENYDRLQLRYERQVAKVKSLEEQIRKLEQEHVDVTGNADLRTKHDHLHKALQRCQYQRDKAQEDRDTCLDREHSIRQALRAAEAELHRREREAYTLEANASAREDQTRRALEALTQTVLQTAACQKKMDHDPLRDHSRQLRRNSDKYGSTETSDRDRRSARRRSRRSSEVNEEPRENRPATTKPRLRDKPVIASTERGDLVYVQPAGMRRWI